MHDALPRTLAMLERGDLLVHQATVLLHRTRHCTTEVARILRASGRSHARGGDAGQGDQPAGAVGDVGRHQAVEAVVGVSLVLVARPARGCHVAAQAVAVAVVLVADRAFWAFDLDQAVQGVIAIDNVGRGRAGRAPAESAAVYMRS